MDKGRDESHGSKRHSSRRLAQKSDSSNSPIADEGPKKLNKFTPATTLSPSNNYLNYDTPSSPGAGEQVQPQTSSWLQNELKTQK